MKAILVPTDLSPESQNAVTYAAHLSKELGMKIILLHVYMLPVPVSEIPYIMVTADEMQKASEDILRKEAARVFEAFGIEVEWMARLGLASDEISDLVQEKEIMLVVMGMKGSGRFDKFMGSTTTAVIRKCRSAVLVIPQNGRFQTPRRIAYATDFSYKMNLACFGPLKTLIRHFNASLVVVHVHKEGKLMTPSEIAGKIRLEPAWQELTHSYHTIQSPDIEKGLQQFIVSDAIDMLAMVAHKHNMLERLFGAHHTQEMAYQTHIPLLILQDKD